MELLKKNIHTERIKSKALLQIPLEADINVSDAKPDGAKVIYDCGTIKVDEIKTGMNKIWVKGKLCYQLLYQTEGALSGDKGDNALAGMDGEIPMMAWKRSISISSRVRTGWSAGQISTI